MAPIPAQYLPPRELWPARTHTLPEHAAYPQRLNSTEELIDRHVEAGRGDRVALLYEDQRLTYRQLQAAVSRLGSALRALGIEEEDRVLLRAPSIPPALVANFAVLRIGGVIVPTSPLLSRAELVHVAEREAVRILQPDEEPAPARLERVERLAGQRHLHPPKDAPHLAPALDLLELQIVVVLHAPILRDHGHAPNACPIMALTRWLAPAIMPPLTDQSGGPHVRASPP